MNLQRFEIVFELLFVPDGIMLKQEDEGSGGSQALLVVKQFPQAMIKCQQPLAYSTKQDEQVNRGNVLFSILVNLKNKTIRDVCGYPVSWTRHFKLTRY